MPLPYLFLRDQVTPTPALSAWASVAAGLSIIPLAYVASVAVAWIRYGHNGYSPDRSIGRAASDSLLDQFMPDYEVGEHQEIEVAAPSALTYAVALGTDFDRAPMLRAIFTARAFVARLLGKSSSPDPRGVVDETPSLGWHLLAELPDSALVMGTVTQPWHAEPVFRGVSAPEFARFAEPGYAKIVWTIDVEPLSPWSSCLRTETRVCTTDAGARRRFRRYWAVLRPAVRMMRRSALQLVKMEAERATVL